MIQGQTINLGCNSCFNQEECNLSYLSAECKELGKKYYKEYKERVRAVAKKEQEQFDKEDKLLRMSQEQYNKQFTITNGNDK